MYKLHVGIPMYKHKKYLFKFTYTHTCITCTAGKSQVVHVRTCPQPSQVWPGSRSFTSKNHFIFLSNIVRWTKKFTLSFNVSGRYEQGADLCLYFHPPFRGFKRHASPAAFVLRTYSCSDVARLFPAESELVARRLASAKCLATLDSSQSRLPCGQKTGPKE